jgi:hypothetical protein
VLDRFVDYHLVIVQVAAEGMDPDAHPPRAGKPHPQKGDTSACHLPGPELAQLEGHVPGPQISSLSTRRWGISGVSDV